MKILGVYEVGSGQKINLQKTSLFFNRNTSQARRQEIISLSGLIEAHRVDIYLGLPALVGRNQGQAFKEITERVGLKAVWTQGLYG